MSQDYTLDRADAADMLTDFGQTLTLTRRSSGAYDPATGSAAITTTTQSGKGVILPLAAIRFAFKTDGSTIAEGDQQLLLSALTTAGTVLTVPHVDDTVTDANGNLWSIIMIDPLSPAGTDVLYDCIVRRAA